jgi:hypothetical protein
MKRYQRVLCATSFTAFAVFAVARDAEVHGESHSTSNMVAFGAITLILSLRYAKIVSDNRKG